MPLVAASPTHRVILGLMTFGPDESKGARITTQEEFGKTLDLFQQRGYNEIDTARVYVGGKQEAWTREAGWKERGLTVATKVKYPVQPGDNTADKVIESVELSLKELGTNCIDLLYLHGADRGTPFADTLGALDKLHKEGKFVRLGISNFTSFEVAEICMIAKYNNWVRPTVYQGMYNAITRGIETELIPVCRRHGIDIVVYNPIAGGLFSGKIKTKDMVPNEGRFSDTAASGKAYRGRYYRDSTFNALKLVEDATEKHGLTLIETALRWIVHHSGLKVKDGNDGIIIGVSSKEQLANNLDNIEKGPLPEEVVQSLDEAWKISKVDMVPYWHGTVEYHYNPQEVLYGPGAK